MSREQTIGAPIIYLFHEGMTELGYLQQLAKRTAARIIPRPSVSAPQVLLRRAMEFAGDAAKDLLDNPSAEVWVVFDHDCKTEEIAKAAALYRAPVSGCPMEKIHIAFMSPCVELWGVLCTERGSALKRLPQNRHELQSLLHDLMPRYSHKSGAQFDLSKMTCTETAIVRAEQWERTHGVFPECIHAPHFAGIYPLVRKLLVPTPLPPHRPDDHGRGGEGGCRGGK